MTGSMYTGRRGGGGRTEKPHHGPGGLALCCDRFMPRPTERASLAPTEIAPRGPRLCSWRRPLAPGEARRSRDGAAMSPAQSGAAGTPPRNQPSRSIGGRRADEFQSARASLELARAGLVTLVEQRAGRPRPCPSAMTCRTFGAEDTLSPGSPRATGFMEPGLWGACEPRGSASPRLPPCLPEPRRQFPHSSHRGEGSCTKSPPPRLLLGRPPGRGHPKTDTQPLAQARDGRQLHVCPRGVS